MTTEEIKKIVDDERAEQLTALLCRHWEVATQRLDTLALEANQRDRSEVNPESWTQLKGSLKNCPF